MACSSSALASDAPREEHIVEYEQVGLDVGAHQRRLLLRVAQREANELGVSAST